jgi:hypothetical protein
MRSAPWGIVVVALWAGGCGLNPQPEPPGGTASSAQGGSAQGVGGSASAGGGGAWVPDGGEAGHAGQTGQAGHGGDTGAKSASNVPDSQVPVCSDGQQKVPCPAPGEQGFGQDGNYGDNPARYTASDQSVTDLVTGLVWERGGLEGALPAQGSADHCAGLVLDGQGGFRLPSRIELLTLVDYGRAAPAIDVVAFPSAFPSGYWSSTAAGGLQWSIDFAAGDLALAAPTSPLATRCVRGGPYLAGAADSSTAGELAQAGTALIWQVTPLPSTSTWLDALSACQAVETSALDGSGWRLPSAKELETLVDDSRQQPALPPGFDAPADQPEGGVFWSSTPLASNPSRAWAIDFSTGVTLTGEAAQSGPAYHVRCVR